MMEEIKKIKDSIVEVVGERFFSPMYFYFIIAWLITNWKFVYVLFFANESLKIRGAEISKLDFLATFYPLNTFWSFIFSVMHLIVFPIFFSWFAVWILSGVSEKFFRKYEIYQQNKRVIQRELEYTEKVRFSKMEREVRDAESDKKEVSYDENNDFNESLDDSEGNVKVGGIEMKPSEVLYNTDYQAYKDTLTEWREMSILERLTDKQKKEVINEHNEDLEGQYQVEQWKDRER